MSAKWDNARLSFQGALSPVSLPKRVYQTASSV